MREFKIQQIYPSPQQPSTSFSTLVYASNISSLVLYGEQKQPSEIPIETQPKKKIAFKSNKSKLTCNDKISVFNLQESKWYIKQATGKVPASRTNFEAVFMEPCVLIYGGKINQKYTNQIYALNTEKWIWKKLFILEGPPATANPIFCKLSQQSACLITKGSLWILHIGDVKWQLESNDIPGSIWDKTSLPVPEQPVFCWPLSQTQVLVVGVTESYRLDIEKQQKVSYYKLDLKKILAINEETDIQWIKSITTQTSHRILVYLHNKILCLQYHQKSNENPFGLYEVQGSPFIIVPDNKIMCGALAICQDHEVMFWIDKTGQLLSVELVEGCNQLEKPYTQHHEMSHIFEEEDQSSFVVHHNTKGPSHRDRSGTPCSEDNELTSQRDSMMGTQLYSDHEQQNDEVKDKLSAILLHEHLKRRLLQSKIKAIQDMIRKSEKFVLLLCRYGSKADRAHHIDRVKALRQQLEHNISKEIYYRKQMSNVELPNPVLYKVDQTISSIDL